MCRAEWAVVVTRETHLSGYSINAKQAIICLIGPCCSLASSVIVQGRLVKGNLQQRESAKKSDTFTAQQCQSIIRMSLW